MKIAQRIFLVAGIYGLLLIAPMYVLEGRISEDDPPAITHPEFFYGFVGLALAWQVLFLAIARDPVRYRPMMIPSILEKLAFGIAVPLLALAGRVRGPTIIFATIDLVLAGLFVWAYRATSD